MKVFRLLIRLNNFDFVSSDERNLEQLRFFRKAESLPEGYDRFKAEYHFYSENKSIPFDISSPAFFPIFNERAIEALYPAIESEVQICPVEIIKGTPPKDQKLFAINILNLIQAFDLEKSEFHLNGYSKKISSVRKHEFLPSKIGDSNIFVTPETIGLEIYVSETFKQKVEQNQLLGCEFLEVFSGP